MALIPALAVIGIFTFVISLASIVTSIWLAIKYSEYNDWHNSVKMTGEDVARRILDNNGLSHIKVKVTGSIWFGNSYSHYFKKVRLRRFTRNKTSLTSLGIGAQKAALAILDKENDPDMKRRIRTIPIVFFGPFAFVPLILLGVFLDCRIFEQDGLYTTIFGGIALVFYLYAVILTVLTLKTEKNAQSLAYDILRKENLVTEFELSQLKELFRLYNIQYVNDIILSVLELIYMVLKIILQIRKFKKFK